MNIAGIETKTVLTAKQGVDVLQNLRNLAFEGIGKECSPSLFRKCLQSVISLREGHSSGHSGNTVGWWQHITVLLLEQVGCTDYVDGDAGILQNLPSVAIVDLAESINSRCDEDDSTPAPLHCGQARVI